MPSDKSMTTLDEPDAALISKALHRLLDIVVIQVVAELEKKRVDSNEESVGSTKPNNR